MTKFRNCLCRRGAWLAVWVLLWSLGVNGGEGSADARRLDELQQRTLGYFWEGGHPGSGLAYEAMHETPGHGRPLAVGGTGFGIAALVAGVERGFVPRAEAVARLLRITDFLLNRTPRRELHGAFPHWLHGETGEAVRFSQLDDGADVVETAFLVQGLLLARAYFDGGGDEVELRRRASRIWEEVDWNFFTNGEEDGLYWHWSPNSGFGVGMKIQGFNECLIAYVLALASPTHPISPRASAAWSAGDGYRARDVQGYRLDAALPGGGPLFLAQYSFIGLDPGAIADAYVPGGYLARNIRHTLANRGYCLHAAPPEHGYGPGLWGLTAGIVPQGYAASDPAHDHGVVNPTAALASFPYAPHYAFEVLAAVRDRAWGRYGPYDALAPATGWVARQYLAIDQLPIAAMVENYRSGLLWRLFMGIPEIRRGLARGGMVAPRHRDGFPEAVATLVPDGADLLVDAYEIRPHPDSGAYGVPYWCEAAGAARFRLVGADGSELLAVTTEAEAGRNYLEFALPGDEAVDAVLWLVTDRGAQRLPIRLHPAGRE